MSKKARIPAVAESLFDLAYLAFAIGAGIFLLSTGPLGPSRALYGLMALTLGCGDAFHLLPRVYGRLSGKMEACTKALGLGKLVTSITMTVFYLLLCGVWRLVSGVSLPPPLAALLPILAAIRIVLCLCPQNQWFSKDPPLRWAVCRNIPFLLLGLGVILLFSRPGAAGSAFAFLPLAVALSFACYLPVVLLSPRCPAVGSLMLPKTLAYVWILCMGFAL